jgi:hypothetical protein
LLLTGWLIYRQSTPPAALPATAVPEVFAAERALRYLDTLTVAPRPAGSEAHTRARQYLVHKLRELGLEPVVQPTTSILRFPGAPGFSAARVYNVLARIPGRNPTGAIALDAHYDGATNGPAAGDCGACVASLLETIRVLQAGPPLRNDVIFVFADAEEVGDLGAHAFTTQHPWMEDVRLALNFEAMGTAGPVHLYATNSDNSGVLRAYAAAAPPAPTNSFTVGIFNLLPEQRLACDLQDFLDAGRPGYGFVFTGNITPYHTALDAVANLSPATVQQLGQTTLALLRHWGEADLRNIERRQDAVFFPLSRRLLVVYPSSYSLSLAFGGLVLLLLVLARQVQRDRLRLGPLVGATLGMVVVGVLSVGLTVAVWYATKQLVPALQDMLIGHWGVYEYLAGIQLLAAAAALAWLLATRRWFSASTQLMASLLVYGAIALLLGVAYPVGNYPFGWPLLIGAIVAAVLFSGRPVLRRPGVRAAATLALAASVVLLTFPLLLGSGPLMALLIRLDATAGIPALGVAPLPGIFAVLLLGALARVVWRADRHPGLRRLPLLLATGAAVVFFGLGIAQTGYSTERPRPESIRYEWDADQDEAQWVSGDAALGEWTRHFIPAPGTDSVRSLLRGWPATFAAPAPSVALAPPRVTLRRDTLIGKNRHLEVRLQTPQPGSMLRVAVETNVAIEAARLNGHAFRLRGYAPAREGSLYFNYAAVPVSGATLALELARAAPVGMTVVELRNGLPATGQPDRPPATMASPLGADATVVRIRREF